MFDIPMQYTCPRMLKLVTRASAWFLGLHLAAGAVTTLRVEPPFLGHFGLSQRPGIDSVSKNTPLICTPTTLVVAPVLRPQIEWAQGTGDRCTH
ncbi:hypothetical protein B0T19DRAFT_419732 [Cercophora scortea]|uniref:Uncharacterized protein n=1 Tax=Cercophora scortea TaxID=314031 RepID=A0AAE0IZ54_9PEZI|nr:hypothetical protein B0T19DRAFT_419732 [Cercophora scortea]